VSDFHHGLLDFDEYLSDTSRFFATFRPFMHEYDRLDRLFGGSLVLAYKTYVHAAAQSEWAAHLEQIGCVAVSEERLSIQKPAPIPIVDGEPANGEEPKAPLAT
jgi:hypothetical protein